MFGFTPVEIAIIFALIIPFWCWRIRHQIREWRKIRALPHERP